MIRNKEQNSAVKDSNINHQVEENIQGKTLDKESATRKSGITVTKG